MHKVSHLAAAMDAPRKGDCVDSCVYIHALCKIHLKACSAASTRAIWLLAEQTERNILIKRALQYL